MTNDKKKIIGMGNYTIDPMNLKILLTPSENIFFNTLMYFEDIKQMYVSLSVLEIYNSMSRPTVLKTKNNLIQLDFIEVTNDTKKGTIYKIKWNIVTAILEELSDENNVIKRLKICDKYRMNKNLQQTNKNNITQYENSPFDININKNEDSIIEINEQKKDLLKPKYDPLITQLNKFQSLIDDENLEQSMKNLHMNEINRLKNVARQQNKKITFNNEIKQWKMIK